MNYIYLAESFITLSIIYVSMYLLINHKYSHFISSLIMTVFIFFTIAFEFLLLHRNVCNTLSVYDYSLITTALPNLICLFILAGGIDALTTFIFLFVSLLGSVISVFTSLISLVLPFPFYISKLFLHILFVTGLFYVCRTVLKKYFSSLRHCGFKSLKYLFIFPVTYELMAISYNINPTRNYDLKNKVCIPYLSYVYKEELPFFILFILTTFVMYIFSVIIIIRNYNFHYLKAEEQDLKYHLTMIEEQQEHFYSQIEALKIVEHDKKHYLRMVNSLMEEHKWNEAKQLLNTYFKKDISITPKQYCDNSLMNSVLNIYHSKCNRENITFNVKSELNIVKNMKKDDIALLSVIVSNALENAFEACLKFNDVNPAINVKMMKRQSQLLLTITNPFSGTIHKGYSGLPISTKSDSSDISHGIGMKSIYQYCDKLNGFALYSATDNIFRLDINICPTKKV